jgi:hypothetical protein
VARFSNRWYARRPYLGLGQSMVEFFNSPVRFLKESNTIESQFEKPYLAPDYQSMQFKIPGVDWPTWKFGQVTRRKPPKPPFPYDVSENNVRRLVDQCPCCFFVWWGDCSGDDLNGGQFITVFSDYPWNIYTHGWTISGNYKNFRSYGPYNSGDPRFAANSTAAFADAAYFDFDETQLTGDGFAFVTLCYNIEGVCQHCVDYWAPCEGGCPPVTPFTFDDASTPDTIAPGGTITMYVLGGSGPFDWTTSSLGYTLGSAQTTARNNTLTSASGTCGVQHAPTANIKVTDFCGTEVDFKIRNTGGQWTRANYCQTTGIEGGSQDTSTIINNSFRYIFNYNNSTCAFSTYNCPSLGCITGVLATGAFSPSAGGSFWACTQCPAPDGGKNLLYEDSQPTHDINVDIETWTC